MVQHWLKETSAVVRAPNTQHSSWLSRSKLIALFWVGTILGLIGMAATGSVGWDSKDYWKTIQDLRHGADPYAEGIAATLAFQDHYVPGTPEKLPICYHYPPMTLPLLGLLTPFPKWLLGVAYGVAIAAGALLQLWAGFQMADKYERRWLVFLLPAVPFFPGLVTDDVILSGNIAYVLYGVILAAGVPGWKRGNWSWYYVAVLAAAACKLPFLSMLAFPVLMERRQWLWSGLTAATSVLLFGAEIWVWPKMFREYLVAIRMMFDWKREFGFAPSGQVGRALINHGLPSSPATAIVYVAFAGVLAVTLWFLAGRVREWKVREIWVPLALVGTLLLSPRIMKYDLAPFTVPMLLIGWRTLRCALRRSADKEPLDAAAHSRTLDVLVVVGAACFLIPNIATVAGSSWFPGECLLLLATLVMGVWSLLQARLVATEQS